MDPNPCCRREWASAQASASRLRGDRLITATPGYRFNQPANASAYRSGRRSIAPRRSRPTKMVPRRLRRHFAQSFIPSTRGACAGGFGAPCRSMPSSATAFAGATRQATKRDAAAAPSERLLWRWTSARRSVRRAPGPAAAATPSAKSRRGPLRMAHRNRHTWTSRATTRPCQGRSAKTRIADDEVTRRSTSSPRIGSGRTVGRSRRYQFLGARTSPSVAGTGAQAGSRGR